MALWSIEEDDRLKQLYAEGCSCSLIASRMPGKTRNAVIGRVHRLGLEKRGKGKTPEKSMRAPSSARARSPAKPKAIVIRPPRQEIELRCAEVVPLQADLVELTHGQCRYPFGDGPFTFCGHPKYGSSSYCSAHFFLSIGPGTISEQSALKISRRKLEGAW